MNVLLTGFTGRVGPSVLNELHSAGHQVHGLVQPEIELPDTARGFLADIQYGDIRDISAWRSALKGMDAVVHLAGLSSDVFGVFETNVMSTHLMALACHDMGVRSIVFASSNCVLGQCGREDSPPINFEFLPVDETHPLRPEADYGLSKVVSEQVLQAATRRWDIRVIALRPAFVLLEDAIDKKSWRDFGEDWQAAYLHSYTHIFDCARAFRLALEAKANDPFEAMYINAADTLSEIPSSALVERYYPALRDRAASLSGFDSLISWRHAESVIGFRPMRSWRD